MKLVRDLMTTDPKFVTLNETVQKAARIMRDYNVGSVPVLDEIRALVGIITDRDIAIKIVAAGHSLDRPVEDCMTPNPESVPPDIYVDEAVKIMSQRQIRRLPVVENGKLIGMLSLADIALGLDDNEETEDTLDTISDDIYDREQRMWG